MRVVAVGKKGSRSATIKIAFDRESTDPARARGEIYRISGEQVRRVETVQSRDRANREAKRASERAVTLRAEAAARLREADRVIATSEEYAVTLRAEAAARLREAAQLEEGVTYYLRLAQMLTGQLGRVPRLTRQERKAAAETADRARRATQKKLPRSS